MTAGPGHEDPGALVGDALDGSFRFAFEVLPGRSVTALGKLSETLRIICDRIYCSRFAEDGRAKFV
jgi:hypothetical protein